MVIEGRITVDNDSLKVANMHINAFQVFMQKGYPGYNADIPIDSMGRFKAKIPVLRPQLAYCILNQKGTDVADHAITALLVPGDHVRMNIRHYKSAHQELSFVSEKCGDVSKLLDLEMLFQPGGLVPLPNDSSVTAEEMDDVMRRIARLDTLARYWSEKYQMGPFATSLLAKEAVMAGVDDVLLQVTDSDTRKYQRLFKIINNPLMVEERRKAIGEATATPWLDVLRLTADESPEWLCLRTLPRLSSHILCLLGPSAMIHGEHFMDTDATRLEKIKGEDRVMADVLKQRAQLANGEHALMLQWLRLFYIFEKSFLTPEERASVSRQMKAYVTFPALKPILDKAIGEF